MIQPILQRHRQITAQASQAHRAYKRFEHDCPNDLWQMDFKGYFHLESGQCHSLTILDDHSRFSLCLQACKQETHDVVKEA